MNLQENTLYTTKQELADLLADKEKVADIFYINFLTFTGLYKFKETPSLSMYIKSLGKLQVKNVDDTAGDWVLGIKLAVDAGVLNTVAAAALTRFLAAIKADKIKSADIVDDKIRDLIGLCRIVTNKPSPRVYRLVTDFVDKKSTLEETTAHLWQLTVKHKEYSSLAVELHDQIVKGSYRSLLVGKQIQNVGIVPATAPAPVMARGTLPRQGAAQGDDAEYMSALLHIFKLKGGIHAYLDRFGLRTNFDVARFKKAVASPEFVIAHGYHIPWDKHPFVNWISKQDKSAAEEVVKILNAKENNSQPVAAVASTGPKTVRTIRTLSSVIPKAPVAPAEPNTSPEAIEALINADIQSLPQIKDKYGWNITHKAFREFCSGKASLPLISSASRTIIKALNDSPDTFVVGGDYSKSPFLDWAVKNNIYVFNRAISHTIGQAARNKNFNFVYMLGALGDMMVNVEPHVELYAPTPTEQDQFFIDILKEGKFTSSEFSRLFPSYGKFDSDMRLLVYNMLRVIKEGDNSARSIVMSISSTLRKNFKVLVDETSVAHPKVKILKPSYDSGTKNFKDYIDTIVKLAPHIFSVVAETEETNLLAEFEKIISDFSANWAQRLLEFSMANIDKPYLKDKIVSKFDQFERVLAELAIDKQDKKAADFMEKIFELLPVAFNRSFDYAVRDKMNAAFLEWCIVFNKADRVMPFYKWVLENEYRSNYKLAGDIIENFPEHKDELLMYFSNPKYFDAHGFYPTFLKDKVFDRDLLKYLEKSNVMRLLSACVSDKKDTDTALKICLYALDTFDIDTEKASDRVSAYWPQTILETAWFVRSKDPHYEAAKARIMDIAPFLTDGVHALGQYISMFKMVNPEMYQEWFNKNKEKAMTNITTAIAIGNFVSEDEHTPYLLANIKAIDDTQIKRAKIDYSNGSDSPLHNLFNIVANTSVAASVKKEMAVKFRPILDVANVKDMPVKQDRDSLNKTYSTLLLDVYEYDKTTANNIFKDLPRTTRNLIIKEHGEQEYMELVAEDLYKHPIKPEVKLDHDRIKTILKYNKIAIKITANRNIVQTIDDINLVVKDSITKVSPLKISEVSLSEIQMEESTLRLNGYRNKNHGAVGIRVLSEFNVEFPGNKARLAAFKAANPADGQLMPVFHGTGSIAASMVLRNGFQIIPSTDSSTVGRMLGNGIYFSNIINKASQYVGDKGGGISRTYGTRGYIFEMEAELGKRGVHYKSAGTGTGDAQTASPEWAVYDPANQLRIYKAYFVELVNFADIKKLAEKHGVKLIENQTSSFDDFLFEASGKPDKNVSTIWFMDSNIPKFIKPSENVVVEDSWDGGLIVSLFHNNDIEPISITVPDTKVWEAVTNEVDEIKLRLKK